MPYKQSDTIWGALATQALSATALTGSATVSADAKRLEESGNRPSVRRFPSGVRIFGRIFFRNQARSHLSHQIAEARRGRNGRQTPSPVPSAGGRFAVRQRTTANGRPTAEAGRSEPVVVGLSSLSVVRRLPLSAAHECASTRAGRRWTKLEGGNRGVYRGQLWRLMRVREPDDHSMMGCS